MPLQTAAELHSISTTMTCASDSTIKIEIRVPNELVFVLAVPLKLINCKSSNFNLEGRSPLINRLKPVSGAAGLKIKSSEGRTVAQGLFERDGPECLHRQVSRFG